MPWQKLASPVPAEVRASAAAENAHACRWVVGSLGSRSAKVRGL